MGRAAPAGTGECRIAPAGPGAWVTQPQQVQGMDGTVPADAGAWVRWHQQVQGMDGTAPAGTDE